MQWCVAAILFLALPARADTREVVNTSLLVAAEASLTLDAIQSFQIAHRPRIYFPTGYRIVSEANPILGSHPTDPAIAGYFAATMLLTAAAWYALPPRLRILAPLAVLILEVPQIDRNARLGYGFAF